MEERLALAGCIVLGIITIAATVVFPDIAASFTGLMKAFIDKITQTIGAVGTEAIGFEWQFYMVFAGVFGLAVYTLIDLLAADS